MDFGIKYAGFVSEADVSNLVCCCQVLDMVEMFLSKQGSSTLVLGMVEPLLSVIESGMSSETSQQEQDFLRRAADIFRWVIYILLKYVLRFLISFYIF